MISYCNRRLYKGNSYEICLPITDTGVTSVRFYTSGDIVVEKEGKIVDDTMCFELTKLELDLLPDGVLRYSYADFDSNTRYVIVTPADYSGSTLEDIIADAFESGHTAGEEAQKAKLVSTAITENGTYIQEDGFSQVDVNVIEKDVFFPVNPMLVGPDATKGYSVFIYTTGCKLDPTRCTFFQGGNIVSGFGEVEQTSSGNYAVRVDITANPTDKHRFGYITGKFYDTDGNMYSAKPCAVAQRPGPENQDYNSGYTAGYDDGLSACTGGNADLIANIQGDYFFIPEGTTKIRQSAFQNLLLSAMTIPDSVTYIGNWAFYGNFFSAMTIPGNVRTIDREAFYYNSKLETLVLEEGVQYIGESSFSQCTGLTSVTLPNTLLSIKSRAFQDDINLLEVNIPDSVTTLGEYAFYNCENMTGLTIGSGITQIEDRTFGSCENLTGVTIPATVTGIGRYVFSDSSGMTSMTFEGVNPPVLSGASDSLGSPFDTFPIYVPCSAVETYKTTWSWSKYKHRITCRQEPEQEATTNT